MKGDPGLGRAAVVLAAVVAGALLAAGRPGGEPPGGSAGLAASTGDPRPLSPAVLAGPPAQVPGRRRPRQEGWPTLENAPYDGRFTFARIRFDAGMRGWMAPGDQGEPPWAHDYPTAERNLMRIMSEITMLDPYMDGGNVYDLDDPELFRYPLAYMSEPGYWTQTDEEAALLRSYLLKGGFLIFDDFRGPPHWYNFIQQLRRVLPDARPIPLEESHPIFHSFFDVDGMAFQRGRYEMEGYSPEYYGIFVENDPSKRLLGVANYNNDIGDYWEWSGAGFLPIDLSNEAYKLGVNYIIYSMTH